MLGKCEFAPDINNCPYYIKDIESCEIGNEVCCFFENPGKGKEINYMREPKWYEQYYKR